MGGIYCQPVRIIWVLCHFFVQKRQYSTNFVSPRLVLCELEAGGQLLEVVFLFSPGYNKIKKTNIFIAAERQVYFNERQNQISDSKAA